MEICQSCDREWVDNDDNKNIIPDDDGFFSIWTPTCPNAVTGSQEHPCPSVILELGPICPATCDLLTAVMMDPQQVQAKYRQFAAKFIFQKALENVMYTQAAADIAVTIMEKEQNNQVFTLRLDSCFDLLYISLHNLKPAKYINITYFLKEIYTVTDTRRVNVEFFNIQLSSFFLKSLLKWCRLFLESPLPYSLTEIEAFHFVLKSASTDMRSKFPHETRMLRSSMANTFARGTLQKGMRIIIWDILQLFPVE